MGDLSDLSLVDRVARLEQQVVSLLEIAEMRGARIDALEAQLARVDNDLSREITHNAIESLPGAGSYMLVPR